MAQIPKQLHTLFWDIDVNTIDPIIYPEYVISRILELGNEEAVAWMKETFAEEQIKSVIGSERRLSPRSTNFWAIVYHIPLNDVVTLRK